MKSSKLAGFIMGSLVLGAVCANQTVTAKAKIPKYEEVEVENGGTILGTVKFEGEIPKTKMMRIDKDRKTCGHGQKPSQSVVIDADSKGIKYAVVSIDNITEGKPIEKTTAVLDQKECVFIPHVLAITAGSKVDLLNSDNVMHNLHSWSIRNPAFNEGVSANGKLTKTFNIPEFVKMTCDVHKWMSAFIIVKNNPYFDVTDAEGNFQIENVPPGTYRVSAWQERLGKERSEITVKAGEEAVVEFVYKK